MLRNFIASIVAAIAALLCGVGAASAETVRIAVGAAEKEPKAKQFQPKDFVDNSLLQDVEKNVAKKS